MIMQEMYILTSVIEIQKRQLGVTTYFSKIIHEQYSNMDGVLSQIDLKVSLTNARLPTNFLFGYQESLLRSTLSG